MDRCLISRVGALGDEIVRNTESQEGKMKKTDWHDQPRQSRLASVMYPHLASEETQKQMADLAACEGKRSPQAAKIEADRGKPSPFAKRKI